MNLPFSRFPLAVLAASTLASASLVSAQEVWPMPKTLPVVPQGATTSTFPAPRVEWVSRVAGNNAKAAEVKSSINLIFDGDSITDGWQRGGQEVWAQRYGKLGAFDFGISGDRTEHLLWRLYSGQVDNLKPKLVAIMIGTNNLGNNQSVEDTIAGVKAVVADYRKRLPDAVILLQGVFPRGASPQDPFRAKIKAVNQEIAKFADGDKVIYVDFGDKFLEPDGSLSPKIMPDALHPNAAGYQIWADAIQPIIDKYFPAK